MTPSGMGDPPMILISKGKDHGRVARATGRALATASFLAVLLGVLAFLPSSAFAADPKQDPKTADYLLHLPGIGGYRWIDREMVAGLREGGYEGRLAVHDWTNGNPGIEALLARERNDREAQRVADALEKRYRESPKRRIVLTSHSGGTGIAVWALEKIPADVRVDTVILLASALSPDYDLTRALGRVRGKVYAFNSEGDTLVLGVGTRTFGTIDGVKTDAAGRTNFVLPATADPKAYEKLVQVPYTPDWMDLDHIGDHVGPMRGPFARDVLTPIVKGREPKFVTAPTTRAVPNVAQGQREGEAPAEPRSTTARPSGEDDSSAPTHSPRDRGSAGASPSRVAPAPTRRAPAAPTSRR